MKIIGRPWTIRVAATGMVVGCVIAASPTPAFAAWQLMPGDVGGSVECLQKGLNLNVSGFRYRFSPLPVDGLFGSQTTQFVNQFKYVYGLSQNGIFGVAAGNQMIKNADVAFQMGFDPYGYAKAWITNCSGWIPHS